MNLTIGIDLGTSTTEAAIYRNGAAEMILNREGERIIPSAVGLDRRGRWVVGARAKAQYLLAPERTAIEVKRKTGTGQSIPLGQRQYRSVELQAKLLSYVRAYASDYLGEDVTRAVISVPAYFTEPQRRETIQAGELAGFTVERILNEPTAAALRYGLDHLSDESHVLVYDLGGGTFDVTLLELFEGVLEVKASSGDSALGGKDFDEALMDELIQRFRRRHGRNLRQDAAAMARLKESAEACKIALSREESHRVLLPALCEVGGAPVELDETITRAEFEALTAQLLRRTHAPIDVVLDDAGLSPAEIDRVLLVGGATRMPMVRRDIARYLGQEPLDAVDPDCAVACGAAIQAGLISGAIDPAEGLVMTDVNAHTLGIRSALEGDTDIMSVVLPRNITVPVTRIKRFATYADWQTYADIRVYQGESDIASHNQFLGEFTISGIPPALARREGLDVSFSYDLNGMLKVSATVVSTGQNASIEIAMNREPDLSGWKDHPDARRCRPLIRRAERLLAKRDGSLSDERRQSLEQAVNLLKRAIIREESVTEASAALTLLL